MGDRYFGEDHRIYEELSARGCHYLLRLREATTLNVEEELAVSPADRAAGVVRQAWATLGGAKYRSGRVRVVWVEAAGHRLILGSNLSLQEASAEILSLVYRRRWQIELFFKWVKCVLQCEHWLAESRAGASVQLYLALIAALLLQQAIGRRPTLRMLELLQLHLDGWATGAELEAGLARELAALARKKAR